MSGYYVPLGSSTYSNNYYGHQHPIIQPSYDKMSLDDDLFDGFVDSRMYSCLNVQSGSSVKKNDRSFYDRNVIIAPVTRQPRGRYEGQKVKRKKLKPVIANKAYYPGSDSEDSHSSNTSSHRVPMQRIPVFIYEEYNKNNKFLPKAGRKLYKCKEKPHCSPKSSNCCVLIPQHLEHPEAISHHEKAPEPDLSSIKTLKSFGMESYPPVGSGTTDIIIPESDCCNPIIHKLASLERKLLDEKICPVDRQVRHDQGSGIDHKSHRLYMDRSSIDRRSQDERFSLMDDGGSLSPKISPIDEGRCNYRCNPQFKGSASHGYRSHEDKSSGFHHHREHDESEPRTSQGFHHHRSHEERSPQGDHRSSSGFHHHRSHEGRSPSRERRTCPGFRRHRDRTSSIDDTINLGLHHHKGHDEISSSTHRRISSGFQRHRSDEEKSYSFSNRSSLPYSTQRIPDDISISMYNRPGSRRLSSSDRKFDEESYSPVASSSSVRHHHHKDHERSNSFIHQTHDDHRLPSSGKTKNGEEKKPHHTNDIEDKHRSSINSKISLEDTHPRISSALENRISALEQKVQEKRSCAQDCQFKAQTSHHGSNQILEKHASSSSTKPDQISRSSIIQQPIPVTTANLGPLLNKICQDRGCPRECLEKPASKKTHSVHHTEHVQEHVKAAPSQSAEVISINIEKVEEHHVVHTPSEVKAEEHHPREVHHVESKIIEKHHEVHEDPHHKHHEEHEDTHQKHHETHEHVHHKPHEPHEESHHKPHEEHHHKPHETHEAQPKEVHHTTEVTHTHVEEVHHPVEPHPQIAPTPKKVNPCCIPPDELPQTLNSRVRISDTVDVHHHPGDEDHVSDPMHREHLEEYPKRVEQIKSKPKAKHKRSRSMHKKSSHELQQKKPMKCCCARTRSKNLKAEMLPPIVVIPCSEKCHVCTNPACMHNQGPCECVATFYQTNPIAQPYTQQPSPPISHHDDAHLQQMPEESPFGTTFGGAPPTTNNPAIPAYTTNQSNYDYSSLYPPYSGYSGYTPSGSGYTGSSPGTTFTPPYQAVAGPNNTTPGYGTDYTYPYPYYSNTGNTGGTVTTVDEKMKAAYKCFSGTCKFENKTPLDVGYATTIVTRFQKYTIYEILRPTTKKPHHMARVTENVFVVKNDCPPGMRT